MNMHTDARFPQRRRRAHLRPQVPTLQAGTPAEPSPVPTEAGAQRLVNALVQIMGPDAAWSEWLKARDALDRYSGRHCRAGYFDPCLTERMRLQLVRRVWGAGEHTLVHLVDLIPWTRPAADDPDE